MSVSPSPHPRRVLVGRYEIRQKLGSGSLGAVYKAWDEAEERLVALKVIRTEQLLANALPRMQDEFRAIASLRHPLIARAYDFGFTDDGGVPYFTREYIEGTPLSPGPPSGVDPDAFLEPILDVLEALDYVHAQGILHLDVHAGNLIVANDTKRGTVLIDFGLVRSLENPLAAASHETWSALPPEVTGRGRPGPASDVYLVGRLLLWRLTGQARGAPVLPRELEGWGTRLTLDLERIATKAMQRHPNDRFASAGEFRDALARALGQRGEMRRTTEPPELLVGRDAELVEIDHVLGAAARGEVGATWFVGESGAGKSRLLREARLQAQLRGLHTTFVRFGATSGPAPALLDALGKARSGRRRLLDWLEPLAPSFGGAPDERARRAAAAYFSCNEAPMALILDDLERADRESRLLADALIEEAARRVAAGEGGRGLGLIVSASRDEWSDTASGLVHTLPGLDAAAARELFLATLRPLRAPDTLTRRALSRARGSPLRIRRIAVSLRDAWRQYRAIPASAELPLEPDEPVTAGSDRWQGLSRLERRVLEAIAVCDRPLRLDELAAALHEAPRTVERATRHLVTLELLTRQTTRRRRRYAAAAHGGRESLLSTVSTREASAIHRRLASHLRTVAAPTLTDREGLARHSLASGDRAAGTRLALDVARELRSAGSYDRAVRLLEAALEHTRSARVRLESLEEVSSILAEIGDHAKGSAMFEPAFQRRRAVPRREAVRIGRFLGIHLHRAGDPARAREVFRKTQALADETHDLEDLVFIDSELAELHIFRGEYADAERACERGLKRLVGFRGPEAFRGRMEVVLRASRGHIELRKLRLDAAREELEKALEQSRRVDAATDRATILHNLGIVESQSNRLREARAYFSEAERILRRAGERQDLIKISTNLALIDAKAGERDAAFEHIERAAALLRYHPGERLECFVAYSRAVVLLLFGECEEAIGAFRDAIGLAKRTRDRPLERFAELGLADAFILCGRYKKALSLLGSGHAGRDEPLDPLFARMAHARAFLIESILGRARRASRTLARYSAIETTDVSYVETWNALFLALGRVASGDDAHRELGSVRAAFGEIGVAVGARFAELGALVDALARGRADCAATLASTLERRGPSSHRFLRAAEAVALAATFARLGDLERAGEHVVSAGNSIVGSPFLEVDWHLELLRARLALKRGEVRDARRHLHRCLHCRDLLLQLVPSGSQERFLAHARFRELNEATSRLKLQPVATTSTERFSRAHELDGMVGRCDAMQQVFQTIQRLREQDVPVVVCGETGTGKDLAARSLHRRSLRAERPYVSIACACLPNELFESELFGHVSGAFTGAETDQPGLLEAADGGTVLLADVEHLSLESQAKLLRVLESGAFRRLGASSPRRIDVRVVATTSGDLRALVDAGRFRRDLYHRLAGVEIAMPPLRERRDDIPLLVERFLGQHAQRLDRAVARIEPDAVEFLAAAEWPGNVRELETLLFRVLVGMSPPERITVDDLATRLPPETTSVFAREPALLDRGLDEWRRELEREYIVRLFVESRGHMGVVMERLGVKSSKLYAWLRDLGLDVRELRRRL